MIFIIGLPEATDSAQRPGRVHGDAPTAALRVTRIPVSKPTARAMGSPDVEPVASVEAVGEATLLASASLSLAGPAFVDLPLLVRERGLLGVRDLDPLGKALNRAGVQTLLAEILAWKARPTRRLAARVPHDPAGPGSAAEGCVGRQARTTCSRARRSAARPWHFRWSRPRWSRWQTAGRGHRRRPTSPAARR